MNKQGLKKIELLMFLVRPVVRFALKHGIQFQETSQLLKLCFIQEASRILEISNQKINVSRLSVATGLQRKDLEKNMNQDLEKTKTSLLSKVIGHWSLPKEFTEVNGKPKILTCEGTENEFVKLVRAVSKDLHPGTLMFELERKGLVNRQGHFVSLVSKILDLGDEPIETFKLLSQNSDDLIQAVEQNIFSAEIRSKKIAPNLHASTEFTKIDLSRINQVRDWLLHEGSAFHKKTREQLAKYDLDLNPQEGSEGKKSARVSLGTFSIVELEVK